MHSWAQSTEDGFNPGVEGQVRCVAAMPGGKLWVGGEFSQVGTIQVGNLESLQWDGRPMKTSLLEPNGMVRCLLPGAGNSLWVGGAFTEVSGVRRMGLARVVENDGSRLDPNFAPEIEGEVRCLLPDGDGVLVGGSFTQVNGARRVGVVRLFTDGAVDPSFDAQLAGVQGVAVNAMARQPDGKILLAGLFDMAGSQAVTNLARLYPGGVLDSGFLGSADGEVHALGVQADTHIVIGGDFLNASGNAAAKLARLDRHGAFDTTVTGFSDRVNAIAIQTDGRVLVGGRFGPVAGLRYGNLIRFKSDLQIEKSDPFADGEVFCCMPQSDGHVLVGGSFLRMDAQSRPRLARLDGNMRTDLTLGANTGVTSGAITTVVQQPDEKLLFAGPFTRFGGLSVNGLVRTHSNGRLDTTFQRPVVGTGLTGVQVRRDQKMYVFGSLTAVNDVSRTGIARLQSSGALDTGFNANVFSTTGVWINAIADDSGDQLWLGGSFTHLSGNLKPMIGRVTSSGGLFDNIHAPVSGTPIELLMSPAGELTIASTYMEKEGAPIVVTRRGNSRGTVLVTYESPVGGKVNGMCRLPDGSVLIWGVTPLKSNRNLCRLNPNGTFDFEFAPFFDGEVRSVSVQADGSMMVLGAFTTYRGGNSIRSNLDGFIHLMPDLRPGDTTGLSSMSPSGLARSGMIQPDGKFVFWGGFTYAKGERPGLARMSTPVPAVQELGVVEADGGFKIVWQRGGSSPQVERVWLSASTNGTTYGTAMEPQWVNGRWESGLFGLPAKTPIWLRAEGRVPSSNGGDAGGLVQSVRQIFLEGEVDVALNEGALVSGDGSEVDFGTHVQGSSPVRRTFTITNRGNDWLQLGEPVVPEGFIAGALSADKLAPGEQATIELATDLSRAGSWAGELVIPSDDLDEANFIISLKSEILNPLRASLVKPRAVANRKTGLREQTIRVRNAAGVTFPAFRVIVRGLPPGVEIRNASEQLPDGSYVFVVTQPLGPYASTDLKVEYFFPKKTPAKITPRITPEVILEPATP
jgi:uncharacterized delta-60 repeat protein